MNEIDKYLDEVCRTLGGSHSLRRHIRDELRDHLEEAIDAHVAGGLPRDEAIRKAIEEFGRPETIGRDLESVYGHRMMSLAIDKAIAWKERTMKSGWKWSFVAGAALFVVIAAEVAFLICLVELVLFGVAGVYREYALPAPPLMPSPAALQNAQHLFGYFAWAFVGLFAATWALFEWRCKSENKTSIRLGVGASVAATLMVAVWIASVVAVVPLARWGKFVARQDIRPIVSSAVTGADVAFAGLQRAIEAKDWRAAMDRIAAMNKALLPLHMRQASAATLVAMKTRGDVQQVQSLLDEQEEDSDRLWASLIANMDYKTGELDPNAAAARAPAAFEKLKITWDALCKEIQCESTDAATPADAKK